MNRPDLLKVITNLTEARAKFESGPNNALNAEIARLCGASIELMSKAGVALDANLAPSEWDRYLRSKDKEAFLGLMQADKTLEFLDAAFETLRKVEVDQRFLDEDDVVALQELWAWHPHPLIKDSHRP